MSQVPNAAGGVSAPGSSGGSDTASTGELLSRLSSEVSTLVRDELRLAQVEATSKAKKAGIGAGMLGAAGVLAWFGLGVLIATAILALALVLDAWLAALIVGIVLLGRRWCRCTARQEPGPGGLATGADQGCRQRQGRCRRSPARPRSLIA